MLPILNTSTRNSVRALRSLQVFCRCLVVGFVGLTIGFTCPTSAFGSCGDYLHRHGRTIDFHVGSFGSLADHDQSILPATSIPRQLPVRRCHGPNCSGSPTPHIPQAPISFSVAGRTDCAFLPKFEFDCDATHCGNRIPQSERGDYFTPDSIFRPPA